MRLGEIAKDLQKTASNELLWLREMRQYVNTWTPERRSAEWEKLIAFEESAKMLGMEGLQRFCLMIAEAGKKDRLAELYRKVLHCAEIAERRQKGGGEDFISRARPVIMERLKKIETAYQEEKEYQISLKEVEPDESGQSITRRRRTAPTVHHNKYSGEAAVSAVAKRPHGGNI